MLSTTSYNNDDQDKPENHIEILFPNVVGDKIRTEDFLTAARGIVRILEKLGKVFSPFRYDIQGNIDKLAAKYGTNKEKNAILQDMILTEKHTETNSNATNALMWLARELQMILLFFESITEDAKTGAPTEDMVAFLKKSYKETLEPYHGWMAQQLFDLLSRMTPTRSELLRALNNKQTDESRDFIKSIEIYLIRLRRNVSVIQTFYETHNADLMM